jgi:hypothetical protein
MEIIDDQPDEIERPAELNGGRIRQLAALRRGAIRARSWCLIAAGVCGVGAIQLVIFALRGIRGGGWKIRAICYLLVAVAGFVLMGFFLRRAARLKREIGKSAIGEAEGVPDFSSLSDGSQRWKNLEELR